MLVAARVPDACGLTPAPRACIGWRVLRSALGRCPARASDAPGIRTSWLQSDSSLNFNASGARGPGTGKGQPLRGRNWKRPLTRPTQDVVACSAGQGEGSSFLVVPHFQHEVNCASKISPHLEQVQDLPIIFGRSFLNLWALSISASFFRFTIHKMITLRAITNAATAIGRLRIVGKVSPNLLANIVANILKFILGLTVNAQQRSVYHDGRMKQTNPDNKAAKRHVSSLRSQLESRAAGMRLPVCRMRVAARGPGTRKGQPLRGKNWKRPLTRPRGAAARRSYETRLRQEITN
jgi:hypothetical protein